MSLDHELPPGPRAPALIQTALLWARPFSYLRRLSRRHGDRFTVRVLGHPPLVFVGDAAGIAAIHAEREERLRPGVGAAAVAPVVGEGSFMLAHGTAHAGVRDALLATLNATEVRRHREMVGEVARRAIATWPADESFALHPFLRQLTLEIVLRLLLNEFDGPLSAETTGLRDRVLAMLEVTRLPLLTEAYLRRVGPGRRAWRRFVEDRARVDEALLTLIDAQRAGRRGGGLLETLCSLPRPDGLQRSSLQIRDDVMSVILAGHETTAAQLAWAFQLLAHNADAQRRVAAEIDAGSERHYLRATVQEALRHRSAFVFGIPRQVAARFSIAGERYEAGAQLLPCTHLLHHRPGCFPDPERFAPERFLADAPDPHAFLPWGGGRRRCPGAQLATLELETVLRVALETHSVERVSARIERPRWRSVIVAPRCGARVVLRPRQR